MNWILFVDWIMVWIVFSGFIFNIDIKEEFFSMDKDRRFHPQGVSHVVETQEGVGLGVDAGVAVYLKQVYALLASSLVVSVAAGYVGMSLPFAHEHPFILMALMFGAMLLAMKVQNTATLFLFTGISGLSLGPIIAVYVGAGLSHVVGQAAFLTAAVFFSLTFYAMTTKRDFSIMGGMLMAGLVVVLVGGLINLFFQSTAMAFGISAIGTLIFSGFILFETQQLKANPWAVAPAVAALGMYLNVVNLFLSLLRLLGIFGRDD